MKRAIVTYAAGAHEELLEVALPTYKDFAHRHGYDLIVGEKLWDDVPAAWNKVPLLLQELLKKRDEVVWFDCDLVIVDTSEDFPLLPDGACHSLVRHFENGSEVPNTGVWRLRPPAIELLEAVLTLDVFCDHGWWEQAAVMTMMGYTVPPQGSQFPRTRCRCVQKTLWYEKCHFMRLPWNSHPNYRADRPRIVHCSYPNMDQRLEVMRALVKDPTYEYPRYGRTHPGLTYLASPYSHEKANVREWRYRQACAKASQMMRDGVLVFSPIAHSHPIAEAGDLPRGWEFWEKYDRAMMAGCERLVVLMLPGWEESAGVRAEIKAAEEAGLPVEHVPWDGGDELPE